MWSTDEARFAAVVEAELALLRGPARHDRARLEELLADDFVEIGRSGRRWTRDEMIASLLEEPREEPREEQPHKEQSHEAPPRETPLPEEWRFLEAGPGLVLVTYLLRRTSAPSSRHSSLWKLAPDGSPRIRFHQGTVVPD